MAAMGRNVRWIGTMVLLHELAILVEVGLVAEQLNRRAFGY